MDLSAMGFDGLASLDPCYPPSDPENKNNKLYGSDWMGLKMAKTEDYSSVSSTNKQVMRSNSGDGQKMLSFSLNDSQNGGFGLYNNTSSGYYYANTGYGSGGVRGPFTPSQWIELEHQALIYKYIIANVAVPNNLLIPIKKALDSAGLSGFSIGSLRPTTYGWGGFHLGFASNTDPEPGRCRRTDGKKWRCSRDAVPDQKYCERHINRGRHRSRKPVEPLTTTTAAASSGPTATAASAAAKFVQAAASSPAAAATGGGGGAIGLGMPYQPQLKSLQPGGPNSNDSHLNMNGFFHNNNTGRTNQTTTDLSMFSSGTNSKTTQFSLEKHQNPYSEPTRSEFGLVFSDSLLNPIHETPSDNQNNNNKIPSHHHFIDEWPKNHLSHNNTQLSISIPVSNSDFISSTEEKKLSSSPLSLRQANWVPISWDTSIGGPLGEVLNNPNQNNLSECKLASSPNGPFQRTAFGSQCNSSAGSSPRGCPTSLGHLL